MADQKISLLNELTALQTGDLFAVVDITATAETKKITIDNVLTYINSNVDNWANANLTVGANRTHSQGAFNVTYSISSGSTYWDVDNTTFANQVIAIDNISQEILDIRANASIGFGNAAIEQVLMNLGVNTATKSTFRFNASASIDVSTPVKGDTWYNGTNLYFYDGSSNIDLLTGGITANTDLFLPVSDGSAILDSLLRQEASVAATDLISDAINHIYTETGTTDADSIKLIAELIGGIGHLTWDGLTGGLFTIIDDKDNELWTASDVSGNPIGYIDADWLVQFGNPFNRPFELIYNSSTGATQNKFNSQSYNMLNLTDYADDTAAGVGGLVTGDLYRTTATKAIAVKD